MNLRDYEVRVDVDVEIRDERMATSEDEAADHATRSIERTINEALQGELSGGESRVDVHLISVRDLTSAKE